MRLRVAYLTFHRRAQAHLSQFGLTADQFVVLSLLAEGDGLRQRELVERTGSDSSTIGAMMKLLEVRSSCGGLAMNAMDALFAFT